MRPPADPTLRQQERPPRILIIDDDKRVQDAIEAQLFPEGYELVFKNSGIDAIRDIDTLQPDVILLDLMMPGMNGFDVCSHIKHNEDYRHVPVIMVTALDDVDYLVTGLETGADEFIAKPVNGAELRARVRSMLRIKHQYDELGSAIQTRDLLSQMLVHDMRNPLSSILLHSQNIQRNDKLPLEQHAQLAQIEHDAMRLGKLFDDMLLLSRLQRGQIVLQTTEIDIAQMIMEQEKRYRDTTASSDVEFLCLLEDGLPPMTVDAPLIERVVDTLIGNAVKFAPPKSEVRILLTQIIEVQADSTGATSPYLRLQVSDQGPKVPPDMFDNIFSHRKQDVVQISSRPTTEVGLAFCKMVVEAHGGSIYLMANSPAGVVFTVDLPCGTSL